MGTGLNSPVQGLMAALIERLNHLRAPVLAVDIPTGLSADTGEVLGVALQAEVTVTFGWPKLGQLLPPGRDYVGRLWQVDISIPPQLARDVQSGTGRGPGPAGAFAAPAFRQQQGDVWSSVGPGGLRGQDRGCHPVVRGGAWAGAGLVTLGIPASLNDILEVKLTEVMTVPLPEAVGIRALGKTALAPIRDFLGREVHPGPGAGAGHPSGDPGTGLPAGA